MSEQSERKPTAQGTFSKTPFAHVLVYLYDRKLCGTLTVKQAAQEVTVYFQEGTPAKVRSNIGSKGLADVMCDLGLISKAQLSAFETERNKTKEIAGQILVRQGAINGQTLVRGVRELMLMNLVDTFGLCQAAYAFYEKEDLLADYGAAETFPLDPFLLLIAGVRAHPEAHPIKPVLSALSNKWVSLHDPEQARRFRFDEDERRLCAQLLKQPTSFDSLISDGQHTPSVVARTLYVLLITRQLQTTSNVPQHSSDPEPVVLDSQLTSIPPMATSLSADPEHAVRREKIKSKAAALASQNYFEMLGLTPQATAAEVRKAFFLLAKEFHPDKTKGDWAADLRETVAYIFSNISEAHTTLTDPNARERYEASLRGGKADGGKNEPSIAEETAVREALDGETAYQKAVVFLRREQHDLALEHAEIAAKTAPDDPEYAALRAHLLAMKRPKDAKVDDLVEILRRALIKRARSERINLYLAKLLQRTGKHAEARALYEKVININSHNIEAAREVRLYAMRQQKPAEKSKGLLGRLFDKDK